ncbi:MAGa3780 family membrane protein [Mycoplasmopsis agassizii]|nr:hypothetical protein [Mycoplasmopsis agassizii]
MNKQILNSDNGSRVWYKHELFSISSWNLKFTVTDLLILFFSLFGFIWTMTRAAMPPVVNNLEHELQQLVGQGYSFLHFTTQSNLILAIAMFILIFRKTNTSYNWYFAAVIWISITFIIYWLLLSWNSTNWKITLSAVDSFLTHFLFPVFGFIVLFFVRKEFIVLRKTRIMIPLYLTAYYIFMIIMAFSTLNNPTLVANHNQAIANLGANTTTEQIADVNKKYLTYVVVYGFANPFQPLYISSLGSSETAGKIIGRVAMHLIMVSLIYILPAFITLFFVGAYSIKHYRLFKKEKTDKRFKVCKFTKKDELILNQISFRKANKKMPA